MEKKILGLAIFFLIIGFVTYIVAETPEISEEAIKNNSIVEVRKAIDNGADVNAQRKDGYTPLMFVALYNSLEIAKLLIENGADVNTKKKNGFTALIMTASKGLNEMVTLLKEYGAK